MAIHSTKIPLFTALAGGLLVLATACRHVNKPISFYYWRTTFSLSATEKAALKDNRVDTLFIRYFDVDIAPGDPAPHPVAPIRVSDTNPDCRIVPVIFIRNRVFENPGDHLAITDRNDLNAGGDHVIRDSLAIRELSTNILDLVSRISDSFHTAPATIQFDCDWTEGTRNNYFLFLRTYRTIFNKPVSATIRLHQVKYPGRTGIPPVDRGVLMYYNMGEIDGGDRRSIYERSTALRYLPSLEHYPLPMDIALPVFTWGLQLREGRVITLLNKMDFTHFKNDSNFTALQKDRFEAKRSCFCGGYYFRQGDGVKLESIAPADLLDMAVDIDRYSNHRTGSLIFYDLDSINLVQYEKDIFRKVRAHLD